MHTSEEIIIKWYKLEWHNDIWYTNMWHKDKWYHFKWQRSKRYNYEGSIATQRKIVILTSVGSLVARRW